MSDPASTSSIQPDDSGAQTLSRGELLQRFWHTARGYWSPQAAFASWVLSLSLLAMIVLLVGAAYAMNLWNRAIFDALQSKGVAMVGWLSIAYFVILFVSVVFSMVQVYLRMRLQRSWRTWTSESVIRRWLTSGRYYQLGLLRGDHANPEARIAEDIRLATEAPIDFASGIVQALLSAVTFIVVLWTIGGALDLQVGSLQLHVPGFLVIAAVVYALIASSSMAIIGSLFVRASETKNQAEAEYRYVLTRLRENGESIALIRGEEEERAGVTAALDKVRRSWATIAWQTMKTTAVSQTSSFVAPVLPIILCAPKLLNETMTLGEVMQAASAFTIVQQAFNWLVDNYPKMADWTAAASRTGSLVAALDSLDAAEQEKAGRIEIVYDSADAALSLQNVSVRLNDGTAVVGDTDVSIAPGERVLVSGESGSGKSTLVRALAGLWPWGGGVVHVNKNAKMFLLPQRPYVPIGTLRRAASYPEAADAFDTALVSKAFEAVGLAHLVEKLDEEGPWDQTLSGGEKQRLAFARILLHKPDIVVLDEATAALDPNSQVKLMELLVGKPELTILSVGHRPELEQFHTRKIVLKRQRGGARLVRDIELGSSPKGAMLGRLRGMFLGRGSNSAPLRTR